MLIVGLGSISAAFSSPVFVLIFLKSGWKSSLLWGLKGRTYPLNGGLSIAFVSEIERCLFSVSPTSFVG